MPEAPAPNEQVEYRRRVTSILKCVHPDKVQGHKPELLNNAEYFSQIISDLRDTPAKELPESLWGKPLTFALVVQDKNDQTVVKVVTNFIPPRSTEEFLSALESFIKDAKDPTPIEERPTLDKFKDEIDLLSDPDEIMEAFSIFKQEVAAGRITDDQFMPTWEYLRDKATSLLAQQISNSNNAQELTTVSDALTFYLEQGLLDGGAFASLTQKIGIRDYYLTSKD